jgi:tetratricopeptide (TPR) repeat protein
MLQLVLAGLRQRLSTVYRSWFRSPGKFDPVNQARMSAAVWIATQCYLDDDDERFEKALARIPMLAPGDSGEILGVLPAVLQANQLIRKGEHARAVKLYRELVNGQTRLYRNATIHSKAEERRDVENRRTALSLLHCNLAQALAAGKYDCGEIDRHFGEAIRYAPTLIYVREKYGAEFERRADWDGARNVYEEAFRLDPTQDSSRRYDSLAALGVAHAQVLEREEKIDQAIGRLELTLRDVGTNAQKAWLGKIHHLRAKLYHGQQRQEEALEAFRKSAELYRDAGDNASSSIINEQRGDILAKARRDTAALEAYDEAIASSRKIPEKEKEKQSRHLLPLLLKTGALCLVNDQSERATKAFDEWRGLAGANSPWEPYSAFKRDAEPLLPRPEIAGALKSYLDAKLRAGPSTLEGRLLVDGVRGLWQTELWHQAANAAPDGKSSMETMLNVMTPLALEVDSKLLADLGGEDGINDKWIPALQDRIDTTYGVRIPKIRLRDTGTISLGYYAILIHEVPRASGYIDPVAAPHDLPKDNVAGPDALTQLDPLIRHLEEVVIAHLADFVAHQEVQNLLERHKIVTEGESHKIVIMEAARHMDPLTKVVRCLVSERTPIRDFKNIYQLFQARNDQGSSPGAIAEEVRSLPSIRERLWGNDGRHQLLRIGPWIEAELDRFTNHPAGSVLVLEQARRELILEAVRRGVEDAPRPALICRRQGHRPLARALVAREFPDLPVLSLRELRPGGDGKIVGEIDIG